MRRWSDCAVWLLVGCAAEPTEPAADPAAGTSSAVEEDAMGAGGVLAGPSVDDDVAVSTSTGHETTAGAGGTASNATPSVSMSATGAGDASSAGAAAVSTGGAGASLGGAGGSTSGAPGSGGAMPTGGDDAIAQLREYLEIRRQSRPELNAQPFAETALTEGQAEEALALLWDDRADFVRSTRQAENDARSITLGEFTLRYDYTIFGDAPPGGRSLFISMHGGGNAEASVNDQQWENQKQLYQPDEGVYLAPRAPTDTWNLWHQDHIDPLFERLMTNLFVLEDVNPDRVYLMGYSAGGDGAYQLGPRMADRWAAAAAMAGHPNEAQPFSLRNIGFTIHVGELDTAYDRNLIAVEWGDQLDALRGSDPEGYAHYVEVHTGKPHWMDLEDAVAVPWMAAFTRNPTPNRIVWHQDDVVHESFYWLAVDPTEAIAGTQIDAVLMGQDISIDTGGLSSITVRLSDAMLDLDQPVSVSVDGTERFSGVVRRTIANLALTLEERGDPRLAFSAEVVVEP